MSLIMIPYMMAWVYFQQMDLEKSLRKYDESWIQDFQMLCTKQKFKNFQVSKLSQYGLSLISINYHVHFRHSVHDGLLFNMSAQMCTIQCHIPKFQSLISFHLSQILILSSNVFKWYSHLYKVFWPAYIITLNLPKPSGNYIFHKLEHSKTLCCPSSVFMHCVSFPT
jgi:hypothetical protein